MFVIDSLISGLVVLFGLICFLFAYLTSQLGGILQVAISVLSLAGAPLVVVFTLGVLFPFANTWVGLCFVVAWIGRRLSRVFLNDTQANCVRQQPVVNLRNFTNYSS